MATSMAAVRRDPCFRPSSARRAAGRVAAARGDEKVVTVFGAIGIWIAIEAAAVALVMGLLV